MASRIDANVQFIRHQKYEQDCTLITTLNAALALGTLQTIDLYSDLYKHYYFDVSNGALSSRRVEPFVHITSRSIEPTEDALTQALRQGYPCEMTTYHLETGWHSVLLLPTDKDEFVQVIDRFEAYAPEYNLNYYNWQKPVPLSMLFDLIQTYPHQCLAGGGPDRVRIFSRA